MSTPLVRRNLYPPKEFYQKLIGQFQATPLIFEALEDLHYRDSLSEYISQYQNEPYKIIKKILLLGSHYNQSLRNVIKDELSEYDSDVIDSWISKIKSQLLENPKGPKFLDEIPDSDIWKVFIEDHPQYQILNQVFEAGYDIYQYYIVNPDNLLVAATVGKLPLTPQTFELGTSLSMNKYNEIIQLASNPHCLMGRKIIKSNYSPIQGWSKRQLMEAIRKYGVEYPALGGRSISRDIQMPIQKSYRKIPLSKIKHNVDEWEADYPLPGFQRNPYMPRKYYEAIYRHLFRTTSIINWSKLIQLPNFNNLMTRETLLFIAIYDFKIPFDQLVNQSDLDIIRLLISRIQLSKIIYGTEISQEITEIAPAIVQQPGSIAVEPSQQFIRDSEKLHRIQHRYQEDLITKVSQLCHRLQTNTELATDRHQLNQLIRELGIEEILTRQQPLSSRSTIQICDYLLQYLRSIQRESRLPDSYFKS